MIPFRTKSHEIAGSNLGEVYKNAWKIFHEIEKSTRRKPYIRCACFKKEKIFFDFFWNHLKQKSPRERFRRLKLLKPAIEVIKYSRSKPEIKTNPNKKTEILYRFAGLTSKQLFVVQIKENRKSKRKYLMSCFSIK